MRYGIPMTTTEKLNRLTEAKAAGSTVTVTATVPVKRGRAYVTEAMTVTGPVTFVCDRAASIGRMNLMLAYINTVEVA